MIKIESEAYKLGIRDGSDAYLLDRPKNNPYNPTKDLYSYHEYDIGWNFGYNN